MSWILKSCLVAACLAPLAGPLASSPASASDRAVQMAQLAVPGGRGEGRRLPGGRGSGGIFIPNIPIGKLKPLVLDSPQAGTSGPRRPQGERGKPRRPRPQVAKPERRSPPPRVVLPRPESERDRDPPKTFSRRIERTAPRVLPGEQTVSRQLLVLIGQDQPASVEADLASRYGLEQVGSQTLSLLQARAALYRIRDRRGEQQVIAAMAADARVRDVQRNYRYRRQAGPAGASGRFAQYGHQLVDLPGAHQLAQGRNIVVAVIDSAVDASHPDLKGAVAAAFDAGPGPDKAPDFHGTAVAGIIRARGVIEGVAPESSVLAIRAFRVERPGAQAETNSWVLLKAIEFAAANSANVLNLSFGGPPDPALHRILQAAVQRRIVAVAAAGNGGPKAEPVYPAAYPEVIAVTAVDERDQLYKHANRGSYISVAAPGVNILAPVEKGLHSYLSGTSFATAYVSGIVALVLERHPGLDPDTVAELILAGAKDLGPEGRDEQFGGGRVNALRSLHLTEPRPGTAVGSSPKAQ